MRQIAGVIAGTAVVAAAAALGAIVLSCAGSTGPGNTGGAGTPGEEGPGKAPPGGVAAAESTFRPSDYGIETWEDASEPAGAPTAPPAGGEIVGESAADTVPGYRVQVAITEDIDAATSLRDSLSEALPGEWVYMAYHAPYYKVRIGNYTDRFAAGGMLEQLRRWGYPDAWVVPDRILLNPLPPALHDLPAPSDSLPLSPADSADTMIDTLHRRG